MTTIDIIERAQVKREEQRRKRAEAWQQASEEQRKRAEACRQASEEQRALKLDARINARRTKLEMFCHQRAPACKLCTGAAVPGNYGFCAVHRSGRAGKGDSTGTLPAPWRGRQRKAPEVAAAAAAAAEAQQLTGSLNDNATVRTPLTPPRIILRLIIGIGTGEFRHLAFGIWSF